MKSNDMNPNIRDMLRQSDLPQLLSGSNSIGISNGKASALIFLSLKSELRGDETDRERAQSLFMDIMQSLADGTYGSDRGFMTGEPGAVRAMTLLTDLGLIERDPSIDVILRKALDRRNFINTIPSIPMPDPYVYGEALAFLSLFRDDEHTLARYALQEYLISLTDNCLRLLTEAVPPLYSPVDMTTSFMHSVLQFAMGIMEKRIFPAKAERIVSVINDAVRHSPERFGSDIHGAILRHLLGDKGAVEEYMLNDSQENILPDLAQLSLFSMAYSCPHLLAEGIEAMGEETFRKLMDNDGAAIRDSWTVTTLASGLMHLKFTCQ